VKGQGVLISALVFALLIAIFAVINVDSVQVNFFFAKTTLPLILVILVSTLLGGVTVHAMRMRRPCAGLSCKRCLGARRMAV